MTDYEIKVMNDKKVEAVSKAIINETSKWEFNNSDYIRLVNALLDLTLNKNDKGVLKKTETKEQEEIDLDFPLTGEQIKIRSFERATDYNIFKSWTEDEFGRWFMLSRSYIRDVTIDQLIDDERNILGIITLPDDTPIGLMGYLDNDELNHKAEMRKLIGERQYRQKGFAKEATILWIKFGINTLGLKKIYLNTIENNIRNVTLNKELGFQVEGILRNECLIDNQYYDLLRMGLIVD